MTFELKPKFSDNRIDNQIPVKKRDVKWKYHQNFGIHFWQTLNEKNKPLMNINQIEYNKCLNKFI